MGGGKEKLLVYEKISYPEKNDIFAQFSIENPSIECYVVFWPLATAPVPNP